MSGVSKGRQKSMRRVQSAPTSVRTATTRPWRPLGVPTPISVRMSRPKLS